MKLTSGEQRIFRLALALAVAWEDSLLDANFGTRRGPLPENCKGECRITALRCRLNIQKFERLLAKLDASSKGGVPCVAKSLDKPGRSAPAVPSTWVNVLDLVKNRNAGG